MAVQAQYNSDVLVPEMRNRMRINMFPGENGTPTFPVLFGPANLVEDLQLQYATNGSSGQLQLLGPYPVASSHAHRGENDLAVAAAAASGLYHPKKKLREADSTTQIPVGNFLHAQQPLPNPTPVSTGLRLAYDDEEPNSSVTSANENLGRFSLLPFLNEDLSTEMERQKGEFEHYMRVQEEQLAQALKEMKQRHMSSFLTAIQEGLVRKMREKDAEIENANIKNKELMEKIKHISLEAQSWHNRAKYNEAMVNALRTNLQHAVAQSREQSREGCGDSEVDDAASSHCGDNNNNNGSNNLSDVHARIAKENKELKEQRSCRICRNNDVSILLLPCRHLCLCKDCESMLDVCPLCRSLKSASVQVYMS
uniref:RING-type domain-containing protein n=1 Tax=Araucaria cunninghamii TaxID=56994 RepID=A0A0D6R9G3_ARACU